MAIVVVTEPLVGAVSDAADFNATISSWNASSTGIGAVNFRDEGLDRRSIANRAVTPTDGRARANLNFPGVAVVTVSPIFTTILTCPPVDRLNASDMALVEACFSYRVDARVSPGDTLTVRLEHSVDGAIFFPTPNTERQFQVLGIFAPVSIERGSHTIVHVANDVLSATLRYRLVAAFDNVAATGAIEDAVMVTRVWSK